jgi:hypothetical protein
MRLADVMNALSSVPSKTRLVILDACRNNPFSAINKTTGRGLAIVDAPNGSLVSYATAPGTEALDGDGVNSPFTTALIQLGKEPGLPIEQVLKRVRLAVSGATNQQQFPWESSSLTQEFSFIPAVTGQEKPAIAGTDRERPRMTAGGQERLRVAASSRPSSTRVSRSEARMAESLRKELKSKSASEAYEWVIIEDRVEVYQAYLAVYPSQSMAPVVRSLLERRQMMIDWYNAITLNSVGAYEAFLASYASSDFATTANRLLERARTRSIANAGSAFAYGPTCPCTPATTPIRRDRRTNLAPAQTPAPNPTSTTAVPPTGTPGSPPIPAGGVAVYDPPPVTVYTDPTPPIVPPVVVPINPRPPHVYIPPRPPRDGHDKRPGHDKKPDRDSTYDKPPRSSGHDKPKPTGVSTHDKPTQPSRHDKPKITVVSKPDDSRHLRERINDTPRIRMKNTVVHTPAKSFSPPISAARVHPRAVTPRVSLQRQPFGLGGMVRHTPVRQMGMVPGRMGSGHVAGPRTSSGPARMGGFGRIMGFGR